MKLHRENRFVWRSIPLTENVSARFSTRTSPSSLQLRFFLAGEWTGQGFRTHADHRHRGVNVFVAAGHVHLFFVGIRSRLAERVSMLHLIRSKGFDFLGNAPKFISISAVATVLCLGVLFMKGERNLGADFRGGDLLVISAAHKLTPDEVRGALAHTGFQNSVIQFGKGGEPRSHQHSS